MTTWQDWVQDARIDRRLQEINEELVCMKELGPPDTIEDCQRYLERAERLHAEAYEIQIMNLAHLGELLNEGHGQQLPLFDDHR